MMFLESIISFQLITLKPKDWLRILNGIMSLLRKLILEYPTKWDEWITIILYTYRTKDHTSLKTTPYEMLFGIRPRNSDPVHFATQLKGF